MRVAAFTLAFLLIAQSCFGQLNCEAPRSVCNPGTPRSLPTIPQQPTGYYARSTEAGEYAGESSRVGIRGFGFTLPTISIELPEVKLPSLVHYRRNPEMVVDSARAPWVNGRAMEFNNLGEPGAAVPRANPQTQPRNVTPEQPRSLPSRSCDRNYAPPSCNQSASQDRPALAPAAEEFSQLRYELMMQRRTISELQKALEDANVCLNDSLKRRERDLKLVRLAQQLKQAENVSRFQSTEDSRIENTSYVRESSHPDSAPKLPEVSGSRSVGMPPFSVPRLMRVRVG